MKVFVPSLLVLSASASTAAAFAPLSPRPTTVGFASPVGQRMPRHGGGQTPATIMMAGIPLIEEWRVTGTGAILGVVSNHPTLEDGEIITTSPLTNPKGSKDNATVSTKSGSKYKLGISLAGTRERAREEKKRVAEEARRAKAEAAKARAEEMRAKKEGQAAAAKAKAEEMRAKKEGQAAAAKASNAATSGKAPAKAKGSKSIGVRNPFAAFGAAAKDRASAPVAAPKTAPAPAPTPRPRPAARKAPIPAPAPPAAPSGPSLQDQFREAKIKYSLNGKSVGDGKYLLSGTMIRSTSGKSQIFNAYETDSNGFPKEPRLTIKISSDFYRLELENQNYNKVTSGLNRGSFVKKIDFLPECNESGPFSNSCALVLESGERNLKDVCLARGKQGLEGKAMRQAAVSLVECVQSMHASGLVWTDLKAENFVVVSNDIGEGKIDGVRGIDLESAVPTNGAPLDYSPEACPPEFAEAFLSGNGETFSVKESYDIWSLGMLLYELSTGRTYFEGKGPSQITKLLRYEDFQADVSAVENSRLRELIESCLQTNPKKRPGITQILLHPYFLTTGFGPICF